MADIQHQDARKLLDIISSALENGNRLTYGEAARRMGRVPPGKHSRAVAQMCDLLDAAACVAGVPLLALVAVREKSGEINPKAFKNEHGPRRDAIIKRSLDHQFRELPGNVRRGSRRTLFSAHGRYSPVPVCQKVASDNDFLRYSSIESVIGSAMTFRYRPVLK